MTKYQEQFDAHAAKGKTRAATTNIYTFENAGQTLYGVVVAVDEWCGGKHEATVNRYTLETDEGRVTCILGKATDRSMEGVDLINKLVRIEFQGKHQLDDGRQFNKFVVQVAE